MKGQFAACCSIFGVLALAGCVSNGGSGSADRLPANRETAASQNPSSPGASPSDPQDQTAANVNTGQESPLAALRNKKLDTIRKTGNDPSARPPDVEAILKQSARPAPEDSEFAVALTSFLLERRTFREHPVLVRVEKLTDGEKKSIRVQTRDGKVHELPGEAIPALSTVASRTILGLLGVETPGQRRSNKKVNVPDKN